MPSDPFEPDDLTSEERHATALASAELDMLSELVRLRHARNLTQEDVAKAIGRDKSAVSRFERLDSDPRLSTVRRYARAVGAMVEHHVSVYQPDEAAHSADLSAQVDKWRERWLSSGVGFVWRNQMGRPDMKKLASLVSIGFLQAASEESHTAWDSSPSNEGESFPLRSDALGFVELS